MSGPKRKTVPLLLLCCIAQTALASPPRRGYWGEDPALVPPYAPTEERRCPKAPAGDRLYADHPSLVADAIDGALLVCSVEISHARAWDLFAGPDLLLEVAISGQPTIRLWGPEDHWSSYVTLPAMHLRTGDKVTMRAWDRDVSSKEWIGAATVRYAGRFPLVVAGRYFTVECHALTADEAAGYDEERLAAIDQDIARVDGALPDERAWSLGRPGALDGLTGNFQTGGAHPLRYAAGFLGWEHPEIRKRVVALDAAERGWRERASRKVSDMMAALPSRGTPVELAAGWTARVAGTRCHHDVVGLRSCVVTLDLDGKTPLACADVRAHVLPDMHVAAVERDGYFTSDRGVELAAPPGERCDGSDDRHTHLRARVTVDDADPGPVMLRVALDERTVWLRLE